MKRILIIALLLICTAGTASAYNVYLKCPDSVQAGAPLKCSLDSNFPAGTTFNLVLYQSQYTATQIKNQPVTIQADHNTQYLVVDTTGLPGGQYKLEVQFTSIVSPSSDSTTLQLITIVDRSGNIEITSPVSQDLDEALRVEGDILHAGNGGVQIEVTGPDGEVFPATWIQTQADIRNGAGVFTKKVPVTSGGDYKVDFSDSNGFIGEKVFTVVAPTTAPTAVVTGTAAVVRTTRPVTTVPTPWPVTTTQSPLPSLIPIDALLCAGMMAVMTGSRDRK
ncbi:hypothetical protein [Methanoregula sp.]|jgi:hypothetical protein|uniref:hypothetical protein n=1 Tax=Methanoregula sp. TaxID=2052170 RepID=UPI003C147D56